MTKLRIVLSCSMGKFKGWKALSALEQIAVTEGWIVDMPKKATKLDRLVWLATEFRTRRPRAGCQLFVWRESRGLSFSKSQYRKTLIVCGFKRKRAPGTVATVYGGINLPGNAPAPAPVANPLPGLVPGQILVLDGHQYQVQPNGGSLQSLLDGNASTAHP